jgi:5-keto 4-deoxyuronate isomerase
MNKPFLLTALFIFVVKQNLISQELTINEATKKYSVENIVSNETFVKDTLYRHTLKWLYQKYPETGIKGTYINAAKNKIETHQFFTPEPADYRELTNLRIGYVLACKFEDRKFSYSFSDFYYFSSGDGKVYFDSRKFKHYDIMIRDKMLKETNQYVRKLGAELVTFLQKFESKKK